MSIFRGLKYLKFRYEAPNSNVTECCLVELDNVVVRVLDVRPDPDGDQDVVVELPQLRDGLHPVEGVSVPAVSLDDREPAQLLQQLLQGLTLAGLDLL